MTDKDKDKDDAKQDALIYIIEGVSVNDTMRTTIRRIEEISLVV